MSERARDPADEPDAYLLGTGAAELNRLGYQHQVWQEVTGRLWTAAGFGFGQTLLDLDEEACDAPRSRIEQLYGRAPPRIRESLQAFGYYEPSVTPELTFDEACWHARFTIAAGEPVRIRTLQLGLTGAAETDPPFVTAFAEAGLKVGDPLDHGAYEQLKRRLSDLARERGYADARFAMSRIDVYPEEMASHPEMAGYQLPVSMDIFRGRYREGFSEGRPVAPNTPLPYRFILPTANHVFEPGHRILVQVQSSWFPLYDRNPQTFVPNIFDAAPSDYVKATQRIFHAPGAASFIELPVIPAKR